LSERQTFATAPEDLSPTSGPALTLTGLIPTNTTTMAVAAAFIHSGQTPEQQGQISKPHL
jgi:hypothetical protein